MNHFKEKLEIETLKALTYTQINKLLNNLNNENKELKKQLSIHGVVKSLPDGDDVWCKASEMSRDNFADWYDNL